MDSNWELGRETRYFNGTLKKKRLERGLYQKDVANAVGCTDGLVSQWETLHSYPDKKYHQKLEQLFDCSIEELFPEFLQMFKHRKLKSEEYGQLSIAELEASSEMELLNSGETIEEQLDRETIKTTLEAAIDELHPREQKIIKLRFGLGEERPRTLEDVAKEFCTTRGRIREIEERALKKLKKIPKVRECFSIIEGK